MIIEVWAWNLHSVDQFVRHSGMLVCMNHVYNFGEFCNGKACFQVKEGKVNCLE
jgi:hypothetical protein